MATRDPHSNFEQIRRLAQETDYDAQDIDPDGTGLSLSLSPPLSPTHPTQRFAVNQAALNKVMVERLNAIGVDVETLKDDVKILKDGVGDIKGKFARFEVAREARLITFDLGVQYLREVERDEIASWAQELSHKGFPTPDLRSFRKADLVVEASADDGIAYVVVEVSYTADQRDTNRVLRNCAYIRQLTSCEVKPVVASVKNDHHVSQQIEEQLVHWHQIDESTLKAD